MPPFEDGRLLVCWNPFAVVFDIEPLSTAVVERADADGDGFPAVSVRVLEEVREKLVEAVSIRVKRPR